MYKCISCNKEFLTQVGLNGHQRVHGKSGGKIEVVKCCCILSKKEVAVQNLDKHIEDYLKSSKNCEECGSIFYSDGTRFCSKSCANTHTNRLYPKRQKIVRPIKVKKEKKVVSEKEKKARNVCSVQSYRARKYGATPEAVDRKLLNKIYEHCPSGYEVDHIIALAVGGSHSPENLQYLPSRENKKKISMITMIKASR